MSEFTPEFFDNASTAWRKNKRKIGSMFYYKCIYVHKNGKTCGRNVRKPPKLTTFGGNIPSKYKDIFTNYCARHRRMRVFED